MSNGEYGAVAKLLPYRLLYQVVRLQVNVGGGLITENELLVLPEERAGEAEELLLTHAEIQVKYGVKIHLNIQTPPPFSP